MTQLKIVEQYHEETPRELDPAYTSRNLRFFLSTLLDYMYQAQGERFFVIREKLFFRVSPRELEFCSQGCCRATRSRYLRELRVKGIILHEYDTVEQQHYIHITENMDCVDCMFYYGYGHRVLEWFDPSFDIWY